VRKVFGKAVDLFEDLDLTMVTLFLYGNVKACYMEEIYLALTAWHLQHDSRISCKYLSQSDVKVRATHNITSLSLAAR